MQETRHCPLEYKLTTITMSLNSNADKIKALSALQDIVLNLLLSPNKECKILRRDNPKFCPSFWNTEGLVDYLLFIGYRQEETALVYRTCDENMTLLGAASKCIDKHLKSFKPCERKSHCPLANYFRNKFSKCRNDQQTRLTDFLSKHYKSEEADNFPMIKSRERSDANECSDSQKSCSVSFNPEGYFQQSCKGNQNIKKMDARKDLFEGHESHARKRESSFLPWIHRKKH